jgi:8-oxo-dGTP pyrophosphatase MutT (NUDIX family)
MSLSDSKPTIRKIFSAVVALNYYCRVVFLILLLTPDDTRTTTLAWIHSTKITQLGITMRSSSAILRRPERQHPNAIFGGFDRRSTASARTTMAPNRPSSSGLFLSSSSPQQASTQETSSSGNDKKSENSHTILDATLVGDYLIQMLTSSSTDEITETFAWKLYSIKEVVAASQSNADDDKKVTIWTDGTEATEALSYGLSPLSAKTLSGLTPKAEILCCPSTNGDDDSFHSQTILSNESNPSVEKDLLSVLQILQTQWVVGLQNTQQQKPRKNNESSLENTDDSRWKISMDSLVSQEGISGLFQKAGLLEGDGSNMEWVEMMTGSSNIVGRLPRSFVHKFNVLHRGIGAFITKDKPIDLSLLLSSSKTSAMPDLYVHRRASDKRIFPSLYDMFVGGVSLAGEDSELTAQREIAEELGLSKALSTSLVDLCGGAPILTCLICTAYNRCLVDLFQYAMDTTSNDETIQWQEEEVAWGDFVDYRVITASADLSMQRAASEGTWPGSYPPIQSELKGVLPVEEDDISSSSESVVKYDGKWKEWDYVPDGLLVWKAWLEMIETERKSRQQQGGNEPPTIAFEVEFSGEEGKSEMVVVELSSMEDIVPQSQKLATRFNADITDMQSMLKQMWADATSIPMYDGPSVAIESTDNTAELTIELPSGLVLELRPSTIGKFAGLGLFVKKASSDFADVLQTQGSAFCGYGPCDQITDSLVGLSQYQRQRSFEFRFDDDMESYVWYKGNLLTVGDVIQATGATSVRSHLLVMKPKKGKKVDDSVSSSGLSLVYYPEDSPCFLVPPAECPDPASLTIQTIGHMCNDLAGGNNGQTAEEYDASAHLNNLLVLVPKVTVKDGVLQPTGMPILTLAKSVNIGNVEESIEVGLRYGDAYWKNE